MEEEQQHKQWTHFNYNQIKIDNIYFTFINDEILKLIN
jgi:hypothetical protein